MINILETTCSGEEEQEGLQLQRGEWKADKICLRATTFHARKPAALEGGLHMNARRGWKNGIRFFVKEVGCKDWDMIRLAQDQ
jgi:hypothetical protein